MADKPLAFIHVRKNAGSSIKRFFEDLRYPLHVKNHFPAKDIDNYFSFGVCRNPYDRCISSWMYCSSTRYRPLIDCLNNPPKESDHPKEPWLTQGHDFRHFTATQCYFLYNDIRTQTVNTLLKYETLEDDLMLLCDDLNIKTGPHRLPKENVGFYRKHLTVDWLNDLQIQAIYKHYNEDFERLGYNK